MIIIILTNIYLFKIFYRDTHKASKNNNNFIGALEDDKSEPDQLRIFCMIITSPNFINTQVIYDLISNKKKK